MSSYFVTGIGTGVGKSFVTAALAYQYRRAGKQVKALKPIVSGYDPMSPARCDTRILLSACDLPADEAHIDAISPWRFNAPVSPHLAAQAENRQIVLEEVVGFCQREMQAAEMMLIEGVGGLLVPLNRQAMVIDWIMALDIPVILVAGSYLGAINHTLLTLHAMTMAMIDPAVIIVSQSACDDAGLAETAEAIRNYGNVDCEVMPLPRVADADNPWKFAPDLLSLGL